MIRVSKHSLKFCNKEKLSKLDRLFSLWRQVLTQYIQQIQSGEIPLKTFLSTKDCPETVISHSRFKQLAYKQASEIIRNNLALVRKQVFKKYKRLYAKCMREKTHPRFTNKHFNELNINYLKRIKVDLKNISITLNENLFDAEETSGEFNEFIRIFLPWFKEGKKRAETICLPIKWHKHSLKFKDWNRRKAIQIEYKNGQYLLNLFWEKEPVKKENTQAVGIDQGYNKLISDSNGVHWGTDLKGIYIKLANKVRGSKNYVQLLVHKKQKINEVVNRFVEAYPDTDIVCERLKNVKYASRLYRKTNNKLQYWSYRQVMDKLKSLSELKGFKLIEVEPAYTSQTCSKCGAVVKANRDRRALSLQLWIRDRCRHKCSCQHTTKRSLLSLYTKAFIYLMDLGTMKRTI